jgi:hypothetical protein
MLNRSTALDMNLHREKEDLKKKKRKMSQIKIYSDMPEGELPQREERPRKKIFFAFFMHKIG